jgi:hypothetical protein
MRGLFRESERVETPPHQAEFWFSLAGLDPLPASGAREAALLPQSQQVSETVR